MNVDKAIDEAVRVAVKEADLDESVAEKILGWFSELATGNESIDERATVERRINAIINSMK